MAHALGLRVVAEGVETAEQLQQLRTLGCDQAQGYFLSRPVSPASISALLWAEEAGLTASQSNCSSGDGATGSYQPERILIVDDAADVRHLVRMSLTAVGYEVHEAANGAEGLGLAEQLRPHCVLLDVSMPGLTGFDVCRALRSQPAISDCAIVMLTANADAADKVEAFSAGADDYMMKPFSPRDLVSRVRACLTRRQESTDSEGQSVSV